MVFRTKCHLPCSRLFSKVGSLNAGDGTIGRSGLEPQISVCFPAFCARVGVSACVKKSFKNPALGKTMLTAALNRELEEKIVLKSDSP
jgi:hypothetical protein